MKKPDVKQSKRHMRVELNDADLLAAGHELADRTAELVVLENEKARITSDFGARIKGKEADIAILTSKIQTRSEYRDVLCNEHLNHPRPGKKMIFHSETGAELGIEDMSAADLQRELEVGA